MGTQATNSTFCTPVFFSHLVDESNDRGVNEKYLVVLVRFFDSTVMRGELSHDF